MAWPYPYTADPLPQAYHFSPAGFVQLTQYAQGQHQYQNTNNPQGLRVAPCVATYSTSTQRNTAINGALPDDVAQYQAGVVVGSATRYYPVTRGGVGMVASPYSNAAQSSAGVANEWHTVGVYRQGGTVWVHDPAYVNGSQTRLPMIPGSSNVTRLLETNGFGKVIEIQYQGLGCQEAECMGRSAQWVDHVIGAPGAVNPFQPGMFQLGVEGPGWQVISCY